jgi:hypothetical protein
MSRRSSLDAELHCVALIAVLALCWNHGIETFAVRMAPLYGRSSFCALLHCMEIFALRRATLPALPDHNLGSFCVLLLAAAPLPF